jgi:hypothetical protein
MNKRRAIYWTTIEVLASLFASLMIVNVIGTYTTYLPNFVQALYLFGTLSLAIMIGFPIAIGGLFLMINSVEIVGIIMKKFSEWSKENTSNSGKEIGK